MTETERALAVPRVQPETADLTDELLLPGKDRVWTDRYGRTITGLRPIQSQALHAIRQAGGGFLCMPVGSGKSPCTALAGTVLAKKLAIILAPARTVPQLRATLADWGQHFRLPRYRVESYAQLSRPRETDLLKTILGDTRPEDAVIVCDEMHRLKHHSSARTKRVVRLFLEAPELAFVGLSGTVTSHSLREFAHLAELALRENAPLPLDAECSAGGHLHAWAEVIDVKGKPDYYNWQKVYPLMREFGPQEEWPTDFQGRQDLARRAFRARLESAPGVVTTKEGAFGGSLLLSRMTTLDVPEPVQEALRIVNGGETPDGDVLVDDISKWRAQRQVSAGFYYYWDWPGEPDLDWLEAKRTYDGHVRNELLRHSREGYDSPALVERAVRLYDLQQRLPGMTDEQVRAALGLAADEDVDAAVAGLGRVSVPDPGLLRAWERWQPERHKPPPPTRPRWISPYLVDDAVATARRMREPVLVWYESQAVAEALSNYMPVFGSGDEVPPRVETCGVSIRAQGEGLNMQDWRLNLVVEPPSSGQTWEQLLGRTHRPGQEADEVECSVYAHTAAFRDALEKAVAKAQYIEATTGNQQKLLFGNWT